MIESKHPEREVTHETINNLFLKLLHTRKKFNCLVGRGWTFRYFLNSFNCYQDFNNWWMINDAIIERKGLKSLKHSLVALKVSMGLSWVWKNPAIKNIFRNFVKALNFKQKALSCKQIASNFVIVNTIINPNLPPSAIFAFSKPYLIAKSLKPSNLANWKRNTW